MKSIGNRIRYYRLLKEWKITDLADATGLSSKHIGHIERGERSCSLDTFIQIANALIIPADELLVDNLLASNSTHNEDEYFILLDCTQEEATVLIKNMKNLKEILRTYIIK